MLRAALALLFCTFALAATAADAKWYYDLSEAKAAAKKEKKLVFIDFTGSDWCGWCMKLKKEVFVTPEFNNYARTNLVLLEIDLPHGKPLSPEQLTHNMRVQEQYGVEGFPTLIVLSHEGQEIWRLASYVDAKPADWVRMMEMLKVKAGLVPASAAAASTTPASPPAAAPDPKKS